MHGGGNDFIVIDTLQHPIALDRALIVRLADRHLGIGCDQLLLLTAPSDAEGDFDYRIFNADGQEVAQCGNGARCIGRYVYEQGLTGKTSLRFGTLAGPVFLEVSDPNAVEALLPPPLFNPPVTPELTSLSQGLYRIRLEERWHTVGILSLGNPHCTFHTEDIHAVTLSSLGHALQKHPAFPEGVNVTCFQILSPHHIQTRTFERGVGETLACGSGACAAVISGILQKALHKEEVTVDMPGTQVCVTWREDGPVQLKGPVFTVFQGIFYSHL